MSELSKITEELNHLQNPEKALNLSRFFKTGKGEYGEGDIFLGITVPQQRMLAKKYLHLSLKDTLKLFASSVHEHRLTALFILIDKFRKESEDGRKPIFESCLKNTKYINNWDLVDLSAPNIIGSFLLEKDCSILDKLAKSQSVWEKRIAIVSTYEFIRNNRFKNTLRIAQLLLYDKHDLVHKAVGWMLREVGKRNISAEIDF